MKKKPLNIPKTSICVRVRLDDLLYLKKRSREHSKGNLSRYLIYCGLKYKPNKGEKCQPHLQ